MQGQEYKKYFICFAYLSLAAKLLWNNARTFVSETGKTCRLSWRCRTKNHIV